MATFKKIKLEAAPRPSTTPGRLKRRMQEYEGHISSLRPGEVGVLEPEASETARALGARIAGAARRLGKEVNTWTADGILYFEATGDSPAARPARKSAGRSAR